MEEILAENRTSGGLPYSQALYIAKIPYILYKDYVIKGYRQSHHMAKHCTSLECILCLPRSDTYTNCKS